MLSQGLIQFLLFSQTFGAGYASTLPRSESEQQDSSSSGPPAESPCVNSGPTATLDCGVVIGTTTSLPAATATVNKFLGVPFAQSPPQRFGMPQSPGRCNINATAWKPACIQQFVGSPEVKAFTEYVFNNPAPEESEDCLYLNVYAPSSPPPADGRAVMFWIYGGALEFGNAGQIYYDGSWLAGYEDVIVVTTNYRTNVFGFATSPEIPVTQRNLGFYDQRFALDWVQRNIAAFGGSPDKVTIFGESAGGFSVDALLTSFPADSKPPFRAAIMESGQISYNAQSRPSTEPQWNALAGLLGCPGQYSSNLTCLRAKNATEIKKAIEDNDLTFNPIGDGISLAENPLQQRVSGNIANIPILGGSNAQEGRVFTIGQTNSAAYLSTLVGNDTKTIAGLEAIYPPYKPGLGNDAYEQTAQIFTESVFQCSAAMLANASAAIGVPTWRYYYNASFSNIRPYPDLGVWHSSEIPIVFSTYSRSNVTTQQYALSETVRGVWAKFAKNPLGGPGWSQVGTGAAGDVLFGANSEIEGGIVLAENGTHLAGAVNLAVFGDRGDVAGSGVTVIDSNEVDFRCGVYAATYEKNAKIG
ncbi:hypothetical protein PRZ48_003940 [Zasmidium cellare]|uniref:Carboxylic ester hydrolase n=1 Tax=Zasmidium cellare TaxID=395010 RepID=A0ABR0EXJ5_ZASCE|nr:hypothetical protein PRZ48_003940 [Zasmidium cellare]